MQWLQFLLIIKTLSCALKVSNQKDPTRLWCAIGVALVRKATRLDGIGSLVETLGSILPKKCQYGLMSHHRPVRTF